MQLSIVFIFDSSVNYCLGAHWHRPYQTAQVHWSTSDFSFHSFIYGGKLIISLILHHFIHLFHNKWTLMWWQWQRNCWQWPLPLDLQSVSALFAQMSSWNYINRTRLVTSLTNLYEEEQLRTQGLTLHLINSLDGATYQWSGLVRRRKSM